MSEVVFRGYLYKSPPEGFGSTLKPWRLRWFVLADSRLAFPFATPYVRLEYYGKEQISDNLDEPKGVIDLKDCTDVVDRRPMRGHDFVFDLCTDQRAYHFAATSLEIKNLWMECLGAVLRNKTENSREPNINNSLRLGVGANAGNMSLVSPIYSSFQRQRSEQIESELPPLPPVRDSSLQDELLVPPIPPVRNMSLSLQDDYQHLEHTKPDVNPPPVNASASANYDTLSGGFSLKDDYQHLDHKKSNLNGGRAATISDSSASLYSRLNTTKNDDCHQYSATTRSPRHSPLFDTRDDYQLLENCTLRQPSKGDYQNGNETATKNTRQSYTPPITPRKHVRTPPTASRTLPTAVARKYAYENVPQPSIRTRTHCK